MRIELEKSVLHVHDGCANFLSQLGVLRVVEVFLFQTHKWTRQWYRIYQRISVGKNEQRLGMGNRQRKRREKEFEREEESETRAADGGALLCDREGKQKAVGENVPDDDDEEFGQQAGGKVPPL